MVKTMEALVVEMEPNRSASANTSTGAVKRPAPLTGGCRIEGFVRVKKVTGNLIISARSGAHSFDPTQMNMSHIVSHLSFGRKISSRVMDDVKVLIPYIGGSHDKLNGRAFINHHDLGANVTIEHYLQIVKAEVISKHILIEEYEYTAHSSVTCRSSGSAALKMHVREDVDAEGSIFHNATLRECEFTGANLRGALSGGANLQSANLQGNFCYSLA